MGEPHQPAVEGLAGKPRLLPAAVEGIPQQGQPQVGKVHPYLVGAAGVEDKARQGDAAPRGQDMKFRPGRLALRVNDAAHPQGLLPEDGQVNQAVREGEASLHQGEVPLFYSLPQLTGGELVLCRRHRPGGVLIQAVDGPEGGDGPLFGAVGGVDRGEGAVDMAPGLVAGHSGGLVVDDDVLVLVEDGHRDGAGGHPLCLAGEVHLQQIAGGEEVHRADMRPV